MTQRSGFPHHKNPAQDTATDKHTHF